MEGRFGSLGGFLVSFLLGAQCLYLFIGGDRWGLAAGLEQRPCGSALRPRRRPLLARRAREPHWLCTRRTLPAVRSLSRIHVLWIPGVTGPRRDVGTGPCRGCGLTLPEARCLPWSGLGAEAPPPRPLAPPLALSLLPCQLPRLHLLSLKSKLCEGRPWAAAPATTRGVVGAGASGEGRGPGSGSGGPCI